MKIREWYGTDIMNNTMIWRYDVKFENDASQLTVTLEHQDRELAAHMLRELMKESGLDEADVVEMKVHMHARIFDAPAQVTH